MDINLFEDLLNNLEIQIKQAELEIQKKERLYPIRHRVHDGGSSRQNRISIP